MLSRSLQFNSSLRSLCLPACVPPEKIPSYKGKMSLSNTVSTKLGRCSEVVAANASKMWALFSTEKNEQLIRSTQTLHHYVIRYFSITNRLLIIISTHFGENYSSVSADESRSIKDNCAIVRDAMSMILDVSKRKEKQIRKIIEPDLYDKIAFSGVSLKDKAAVIRDFHADKLGVFGNICLPLVAIQLTKSELENVKPPTEEHDLPILSFKLRDLVKSSKSIAKLLCEQRSQQTDLSEATQLVEDGISILKPPCDSYDDIAGEVQACVKIISEHI